MSLTKYLSTGAEAWQRAFTLDTLGNVHVADIALDTAGNVLVTGAAYNGAVNQYDLFVVKYNPSGTKLWQYLSDDAVSFAFAHIDTSATTSDTIVRLDLGFSGTLLARTDAAVGLERQAWFHNCYHPHIPKGRERTPLENKVLFPNLYEHTDAIFGQGTEGFFIRFVHQPGSDPDDLEMEFTGATALSVLPNGDL